MFYLNTYIVYRYYSIVIKGVRLYNTHTYIRNNYSFLYVIKKKESLIAPFSYVLHIFL